VSRSSRIILRYFSEENIYNVIINENIYNVICLCHLLPNIIFALHYYAAIFVRIILVITKVITKTCCFCHTQIADTFDGLD